MFPLIQTGDPISAAALRTLNLERTTIPDSWHQLLKHVGLHFPEVVLAGGALRDLSRGKPIKDVDLFVNPHEKDTEFMVVNFEAELKSCALMHDDSYPPKRCLQDIYRFSWADYMAEVIVVTDPIITDIPSLVDTFDIGLCQVGMDRRGTIYASSAFWKDMAQQTLTVVNDRTPVSTWRRLNRIGAKYPEYTINADLIGMAVRDEPKSDFERMLDDLE
jgi:hypothetical protein